MLVTANNNINNNEYKKRLRSYKLEVKNEVKNEGKIEMLYENILVHNAEPDCLICLESSQQTNKLIKMKDFVLVDSSNCLSQESPDLKREQTLFTSEMLQIEAARCE